MAVPSQLTFLLKYRNALRRAEVIVDEHERDGENSLFTIQQLFPHGYKDCLFMTYHKAARALSFDETRNGNVNNVLDSLYDLINYAAFAIAFLEPDSVSPTS